MVEFKVADGLSDEVAAFKKGGEELAADSVEFSTGDIKTLKTSMRYLQQQKDIQSLLRLYSELLVKDSKDLERMISEAKRLDQVLSTSSK